ncbi:hypothetical protein PVAP13_4NG219720 [Panicum virgatum]|uniref:Uncharacterized protein n=1 Tax=Panicum virgatum TaxID=38727 RepID=A0A8T0T832_PANVG|nr:hypothetical protein PVAP13_4NG219720 [Panicum virgatum]
MAPLRPWRRPPLHPYSMAARGACRPAAEGRPERMVGWRCPASPSSLTGSGKRMAGRTGSVSASSDPCSLCGDAHGSGGRDPAAPARIPAERRLLSPPSSLPSMAVHPSSFLPPSGSAGGAGVVSGLSIAAEQGRPRRSSSALKCRRRRQGRDGGPLARVHGRLWVAAGRRKRRARWRRMVGSSGGVSLELELRRPFSLLPPTPWRSKIHSSGSPPAACPSGGPDARHGGGWGGACEGRRGPHTAVVACRPYRDVCSVSEAIRDFSVRIYSTRCRVKNATPVLEGRVPGALAHPGRTALQSDWLDSFPCDKRCILS